MFAPTPNTEAFDQTQFGSEGLYFDANKPTPVINDPSKPQPKFWQTSQGRMVLVVMAVFAVILMVISLAWLLQPKAATTVDQTFDDAEVEVLDLGPLGEKAKALRSQLKAADPAKELDPQPPINIELRLDPLKE